MKLQTTKRVAENKSEGKKLRREGYIPAVLYVKEKAQTPWLLTLMNLSLICAT